MDYYDLDIAIQSQFTPKEWAWLSDKEKAALLQQATEPDYTEDMIDGD